MRITKLMVMQYTPETLRKWYRDLPESPYNPYFTSEAKWQAAVEKWTRGFGWLTYHTHDSNRSTEGFPDLCAVHPRCGCEIVAELKSASSRADLSEAQASWVLAYALDPERYVFVLDPRDEDGYLAFLQLHQDMFQSASLRHAIL